MAPVGLSARNHRHLPRCHAVELRSSRHSASSRSRREFAIVDLVSKGGPRWACPRRTAARQGTGHPQFSCSLRSATCSASSSAATNVAAPFKGRWGQPAGIPRVGSQIGSRPGSCPPWRVGRSRPPWPYAERRVTAVLTATSGTMPHLGTTRRTLHGHVARTDPGVACIC